MAAGKGLDGPSIIIKRVEASGEGGHHGGAWKVAYADFVTAMMAFFLLLWLLSATTEDQKSGLADYFAPTVIQTPSSTTSGGGEGSEEGVRHAIEAPLPDTEKAGDFEEVAKAVQDSLTGTGAESAQLTNLLQHVVTRMTDEGLVIELGDLTGAPLFVEDTAQPQPALTELMGIIARVIGHVRNDVALTGHVRAYPETLLASPVWPLSDARAHTVRNLLEQNGFNAKRVQRVSAFGDRKPRRPNPMDPLNNRVELILLR